MLSSIIIIFPFLIQELFLHPQYFKRQLFHYLEGLFKRGKIYCGRKETGEDFPMKVSEEGKEADAV